MHRIKNRVWWLPALLLTLALMAGCNSHRDKIGDIERNPSSFADRDVTVAGEVTKVYELPLGLADVAAFRVSDGTGQIWILSRAGAPREGDKVGIKGKVHPEGHFGDTILGSVIEETGRKVE